MIAISLSELRDHAEEYFDAVESGQELEIHRGGQPVAVVHPFPPRARNRWKTAAPKKLGQGISLSKAILAERDES